MLGYYNLKTTRAVTRTPELWRLRWRDKGTGKD